MNFLITMAGDGFRFKSAGYTSPKWKLKAHGKTMLEWSVDSLPLEICSRLIFIAKDSTARQLIEEHYGKYNPKILILSGPTRGQAETVLMAKSEIDLDQPIIIYNIDTMFVSTTLKARLFENSDGVLGSFKSNEDRFSFARTEDGRVVEVVEKNPISDNALTGLYHFHDTREALSEIEDMVQKDERVKGEFYVAPVYQRLINKGRRFILDEAKHVSILGTPSEYESFKHTLR